MPRKNHNKFVGCNNQLVHRPTGPSNNCAFRIRGLPASTSYCNLFCALRGTGAIRYCSITPDVDGYMTATATVRYFSQTSANILYDLAQRLGFRVNNVCPILEWQSGSNPEFPNYDGQSRGLCIRGPPSIVNYRVLEEIWNGSLHWTKDFCNDSGEGEVVYYFTAWDDQSKIAKHVLERDLGEAIRVDYVQDPCGCDRR